MIEKNANSNTKPAIYLLTNSSLKLWHTQTLQIEAFTTFKNINYLNQKINIARRMELSAKTVIIIFK